MSNLSRFFCALFLVLSACSRLQLAYNWADTALIHTANKYFDLRHEQEKRADELIHRDLKTLVKRHGPALKQHLYELAAMVENKKLSQKEFDSFFDKVRGLFYQALTVAEPSLQELARTLTPEQIIHFQDRLKKDVSDKRDDFGTEKARRKELQRRSQRWMNMLDVDLNTDQKKLFDQYLTDGKYPFLLEQDNRLEVADKFFKAFSAGSESLDRFIHQALTSPVSLRNEKYQTALDQEREQLRLFQWRLLVSLTDQQRRQIVDKIHAQIAELEKIQVKAL